MVFQDETGFSLHPRLSRGWAKRGKPFKVPTTSQHRKRLNLSGWVAPLLGRRGLIRTVRGDRQAFLNVLKHIRHRLKGFKVWIYVDKAPWHKGVEVKEYLISHRELRLRYLPPYQPALNMQERVWRQMRYEMTTNCWFEDLEVIWESVQINFRRWSPKKIKQLCNLI
ncbi:MAG: IS630 family transposase [bacterium]